MIPFRTKDLVEFSSRFDIYNNIDKLSIEDLACLSKINKIDYFVSNVKKEEISIYRDRHWFLYKINLTDCQEL